MLIIDNLDQLSDDDQGRSEISFLKGVRPHPDSIVLVSTLPDHIDTSTYFPSCILLCFIFICDLYLIIAKVTRSYFYGCETKLRATQVPMLGVGHLNGVDTRQIFEMCLRREGQALLPHQWDILTTQSAHEPSALFVALAVVVVKDWVSFTPFDQLTLHCGVEQLLSQIFRTLQKQFGKRLVYVALSFLTQSNDGISDTEMEDLLSLHDGVMIVVNQFAIRNKYSSAVRFPSVIWLRLRHALSGLICSKDEGKLFWYHRQIWETAAKIFGEDVSISAIMGRYFSGAVTEAKRSEKGVMLQPLVLNGSEDTVWFPASIVNKRRCVEAATHLRRAVLFQNDVFEMCSIESVRAYAECGQFY